MWCWPFATSPTHESGSYYETNGLEGRVFSFSRFIHNSNNKTDASIGWPPPDPDRIPRMVRSYDPQKAFTYDTTENGIEAFHRRQQKDSQRWNTHSTPIRKRRPFHNRYDPDADTMISFTDDESEADDGEEGWKNSEGERLRDFGVDEEIEFYDEDDIPLAELIQRRGLGGKRDQPH